MTVKPIAKTMAAVATLVVIALAGTLVRSRLVSADNVEDHSDRDDARIQRGFEIAPVHLRLRGKDRDLVGLGSYLVNTGGCNDCHTNSAQTEFADGGNPYFGQPKKINTATYLGGGMDFGA